MADILANPVEICFGSFTATSTTMAAATSPTTAVKVLATFDAAPSTNKKSKTNPPKPYVIVQRMECVIDMMKKTLQICERAQVSSVTGYSPIFLVYGSEAVLPTDVAFGAPRIQHYEEETAEETRKVDLDSIEEHRVAALMRHTWYEQQLCRYHDRNVRERSFNVGDLVLRRIQSTKGMHKLSAPWEGPFIVMEVVKPSTYRLQWADGQSVPNVWNIEHLRRFYP
jgi:hypothetical protein